MSSDPPPRSHIEVPTILLAGGIYSSWFVLTYTFQALPLLLGVPLAAFVVAWQSSLQHEISHGHPTSSRLFNSALASFSLWLYLPFPLYRDSHMAHHASEHLTSPLDDSESYFFTSDTWAGFGRIKRAFWTVHNTLLGRLLLGPVAVLGRVYPGELAKIVRGDLSHIRYWTGHALVVAAILSWCHFVCNIAVWEYMLYFVYPGMALGLLRSFAEHTPGDTQEERIAVVETNPILGLLFLNNNLHILHHTRPGLPWYQYRARYEQEREALLEANGGLLYRGYRELFRRFSFRAIASPAHPMERVQ